MRKKVRKTKTRSVSITGLDVTDSKQLEALGWETFDAAVSNMAIILRIAMKGLR